MQLDAMFNCKGKVNPSDWQLSESGCLFLKTEIENVILSSQESLSFSGNIKLFDSVTPRSTAALNLKHLTSCTEMKLKLLNRKTLPGSKAAQPDFYFARKSICEFLVYIRSYLYSIKWDPILTRNTNDCIGKDFEELSLVLKDFFSELKSLPDAMFHYAASNLGNKCNQQEFHLYHAHLELRWLGITLLHAIECPEGYTLQIDSIKENACFYTHDTILHQTTDLDVAIAAVVDDLIYVAVHLFERIQLDDLQIRTPYSCTCMRELWVMLQIFVDYLATNRKSKSFWSIVNDSLDTQFAENDTQPSSPERRTSGNSSLKYKNSEIFCLWLIYHLALLYGFNLEGDYVGVASTRIHSNYERIEKILKVYVSKGGKAGERTDIDKELQGMIPLLTILGCEWWQQRAQIVSLLWECFHKRLNTPFLLQTTGPWLASIEKKGPADILKEIKHRLDVDYLEQNKVSSYGLFLRLLGIFLRKSSGKEDSKHWNQMKGRIYSKFTEGKIAEFSEAGLYNFISLFLTLALTTNTSEVCTMMFELLPSVLLENLSKKQRIIVWKGELAVLLLFAERKIDFGSVSNKFLREVDAVSCRKDETSRVMLTTYIGVLDEILKSSEKMELSEHLLIGGWVDRYLLESPQNKVNALIVVIINIINKCIQLRNSRTEIGSALTGSPRMLEALWSHVAGRVRMLVLDAQTYGDNYYNLSDLATKFTLEAMNEPVTAARYKQNFVSLFKHFSSSPMIKDARIIQSYLTQILQYEEAVYELRKKLQNFDVLIIQAWIKCSVLKCETENNETRSLTHYVLNCDEIIQIFQSKSELQSVENSTEPILLLMQAFMTRRKNSQTVVQSSLLAKKCIEYFANIEKWAMVPITEETKDARLTHWIYRCIGKFISCCSLMLHSKSQTNSMLIKLINTFMLSSEKLWIPNVAKRIFPTVISGLCQLDVKGDVSLQIAMNSLFDRYLPHLIVNYKISEELLKCFCGPKTEIIFDKITHNFIVCRDGTTHKYCSLVMFLLRQLVKNSNTYGSNVTGMIITICLPRIISCYMKVQDLHSHRQQTIDLLQDLTRCSHYREDPNRREDMKLVLMNTMPTHLLATSRAFFQFMSSICKIIPQIAPYLISKIENTILNLENNKHPHVESLRFSLNQLQTGIQVPNLNR